MSVRWSTIRMTKTNHYLCQSVRTIVHVSVGWWTWIPRISVMCIIEDICRRMTCHMRLMMMMGVGWWWPWMLQRMHPIRMIGPLWRRIVVLLHGTVRLDFRILVNVAPRIGRTSSRDELSASGRIVVLGNNIRVRVGLQVTHFRHFIWWSTGVVLIVGARRGIRTGQVQFLAISTRSSSLACLVLKHVLGLCFNRPVVALAWFTESLALFSEERFTF